MFTGIIEEMGTVNQIGNDGLAISAQVTLQDLQQGDSISVNGACLTITSITGNVFTVDITPETLSRTNLGNLRMGDPVNLERSLPANGRFGGHITQGHIDARGTVLAVQIEGNSLLVRFEAPFAIMRYLVEKAFIAVDGVSLTIAFHDTSSFTVSVIPFTREHTILGTLQSGDLVNLEIDILAKYVESFLQQSPYGKSDKDNV